MEIVKRPWGEYEFLDFITTPHPSEDHRTHVIKRLNVEPNKCLSMQRHHFRDEYWVVLSGEGCVIVKYLDSDRNEVIDLEQGTMIKIEKTMWHCLVNTSSTESLTIIEVQSGVKCDEKDIDRK